MCKYVSWESEKGEGCYTPSYHFLTDDLALRTKLSLNSPESRSSAFASKSNHLAGTELRILGKKPRIMFECITRCCYEQEKISFSPIAFILNRVWSFVLTAVFPPVFHLHCARALHSSTVVLFVYFIKIAYN